MAVSQAAKERPCLLRKRRQLRPHVAREGKRDGGGTEAESLTNQVSGDCPQCGTMYAPDASLCRRCGWQRLSSISCASCSNLYAPDSNFCRRCGVQRPEAAERPSRGADPSWHFPNRKRDILRGAANLKTALQFCLQRVQAEHMLLWKEVLAQDRQSEAAVNEEQAFHPFSASALSSVHVVREEDEEVVEAQLPPWQLSRSLEDVREWGKLRRLARLLAAWHRLAAGGTARRLIKSVCGQFRVQVLTTRAFAALSRNWQLRTAHMAAVAHVVDHLADDRLRDLILKCLRAWRSRAVKGAIRRRGERALTRFLDASCLRRWLSTWVAHVAIQKRISGGMADLECKQLLALRRKACRAWGHVWHCARATKLVLNKQQAKSLHIAVQRWVGIWKARSFAAVRLVSAAWAGLQAAARKFRAVAAVSDRCRICCAKLALLRWIAAKSLRRREAECRQQIKVHCLQLTLQRWNGLHAAKVIAAHSAAQAAFQRWQAALGRLIEDRRQREANTVGPAGSGPTPWQHKQGLRLLRCSLLAWAQAMQRKRRHRRRTKQAQADIQKLVVTQALWFWHSSARDSAMRHDQIQRASMALAAMVSASRWARAHDCLVQWFTRTQARRIMCKETDLSGDASLVMSPWPDSPKETPGLSLTWSSPRHVQEQASSAIAMEFTSPSEHLCLLPTAHAACSIATVPKRWLKLAVMLLSDAALPVMQWSWCIWQGAHLRLELISLRWWSLVLKTYRVRKQELKLDFRRLRWALKTWYDVVAESIKQAVAEAEAELNSCQALCEDTGVSHRPLEYPTDTHRAKAQAQGLAKWAARHDAALALLVGQALMALRLW
ncbi:unnamed protein product [Effrenium voratum]|nr:unnamed protein product [Effrenium voratum]